VEDLDFIAGTLRHQPKGHRAKDAIAVLSQTALEALKSYLVARSNLTGSSALFEAAGNRRAKSGGLTERTMRAIVLELTEETGLARRTHEGHLINPGHYSAHSIRRASITTAAEHLGMEAAQTLAGHACMDTTRRAYARVNKYRQLKSTASILDL
jgi:integrase